MPINNHILYLPERYSIATSDLIFQAILPPLGFSSFIIDKLEPSMFSIKLIINFSINHNSLSFQLVNMQLITR